MAISSNLLIISIAIISAVVFSISLLMKMKKIPLILSYILVGFLIGPHFLNLISDISLIMLIGNIGVVLLLFFIGMNISLEDILDNWKISLIGTTFQIILSVIVMGIIGTFLDWPLQRILLIGFVICMSSTVVILKILEARNEENNELSKKVLSVAIIQDIMIIPILVILNVFSGQQVSLQNILLQIIGMVFAIGIIIYLILNRNSISIPYINFVKKDFEIQVAFTIMFCFGIAAISMIFGLSAGLGAFIAGLIISASKQTKWVSQSLNPFQIVFVALFFISVGMLIDIDFIVDNILLISFLTVVAFLLNILINISIFLIFKLNFKDSLYGALLLSHIGEFSFVLAAFGLGIGSISTFGYHLAISIITMSLIIMPIIIGIFRLFVKNTEKVASS